MQEIRVLIEFMSSLDTAEIAGATIVGVLTASIGAFIATIKNKNKRLKNSVSKIELERGIEEAKQYTNVKLKIHEDKQILELKTIEVKINETHAMVGKLLDIQLNK